jgi:exodeoxyribonuclease VII large subunit
MQDDALPPTADNQPVFSLSELSQSLKQTIESVYDHVRVRAEISRPTRAASGHVYFTLKDDTATLDAVCWKTMAGRLKVEPEEGLEVIVTGKLTTYPGRSKYQIVVQDIELAGEGALLKQLEERRRRLAAEGLFDEGRKKPLPPLPRVIGVVTSPTGAVIRDILHRLEERFPVRVLLWPVLVQGQRAEEEITAAIQGFDSLIDAPHPDIPVPDLLIVARGGGSLEDLMAFNAEAVVRAVAACRLPVISAVGHETDTTLIDFAADRRAPTPTAAAEMATPVAAELRARLSEMEARLSRSTEQIIERARDRVRGLDRALGDPEMLLATKSQRLDLALASIDRAMDSHLTHRKAGLDLLGERLLSPESQMTSAAIRLNELDARSIDALMRRFTRLQAKLSHLVERLPSPASQLAAANTRLDLAAQKIDTMIDGSLMRSESRLGQASRLLEAASFQKVLNRGFALITGPDAQVMRSADQYGTGTEITVRLGDGQRQAVLGNGGGGDGEQRKARQKSNPRSPASGNDKGQQDLF